MKVRSKQIYKAIEVEDRHLDGPGLQELKSLIPGVIQTTKAPGHVVIMTRKQRDYIEPGDFIVFMDGSYKVYDPIEFEQMYARSD